MNRKTEWLVFLAAFFLIFSGTLHFSFADDDDHRKKRWYDKILDLDDDDSVMMADTVKGTVKGIGMEIIAVAS